MRYHELLEDDFDKQQLAYKEKRREAIFTGAKLIKRDCQPYLSQVSDPMKLRRGVKRDYDADSETGRPMFNKKQAHLTNRMPRALHLDLHIATNDYFETTFGHPFRNGIMTVGDQMHSSGFGIDVAVFPIGNFEFLWSPEIQDLNYTVKGILDGRDRMISGFKPADLVTELVDANYQTTDLQAAIDSKNEIMIWAEEYYTLDNNADRLLVKKLLK